MTTYRLLIAIEHALPDLSLVDYRKLSSEKGMRTSPANVESMDALGIEHYWEKSCIQRQAVPLHQAQ
jgi:hypothetical protein